MAAKRPFLELLPVLDAVGGVVRMVTTLALVGATIGLLFKAIADTVYVFTSGTTNSTTVDLLLPVFGAIIAVAGVVVLVRVVLRTA